MARGLLITWFGGREFGFIQPDDGGPDVLVHARDFVSQPHEGQSYEFKLLPDRNRRSGYRAGKIK